jgi:hypothetical protein
MEDPMSILRVVSTSRALVFGLFGALGVAALSGAAMAAADNKLVYADFELPLDQRPVSSRGGWIQMTAFQEDQHRPVHFKGMDGQDPPAPAVKFTSKDQSNKAIAFEFELTGPNQWGGVGVEVHGQADQDGKPQPDDVSVFKTLTLQIYTAEVTNMRVEFLSHGAGVKVDPPPQFAFHTKPGFNTYKVKLSEAIQPTWVETKSNPTDVLKQLTSVNVLAVCDDCRGQKGLVVLDNLVFEK